MLTIFNYIHEYYLYIQAYENIYAHSILSDEGWVRVVVDSHPDDIIIIVIVTSKSFWVEDFSSVLAIYSAHILHFNVADGRGVV